MPLVSKMLRCQMRQRYTTLPRQDVRSGADAVNGASVYSHPQSNATALPAACAVSNSATAKHVCNSGATETLNAPASMPTVSMEEFTMIMSCTQGNHWIRKQLNSSLVSAKVSSTPRQTQRSSNPLHQASTAALVWT